MILPIGNYTIDVAYSGNYKYNGNSSKSKFKVVKAVPTVNVNTTDIDYNTTEPVKFNVTGVDGGAVPTGNVTVVVTNSSGDVVFNDTVPVEDGLVTVPVLPGGKYNVTVTYNGDANYTEAIGKANFTVSAIDSIVCVDPANITYGDIEKIRFNVTDGATGTFNVTVIGADAGSSQSKVENVVVGNGAYVYDSYSVAIGDTARTEKANSIAVGQGAHTTGVNSVAIGNSTYATGNNSIAIGIKGGSNDSYKPGQDTIVIGYQARSSQATGATLIGTQLFTNSGPTYSVGIGHSSQVIGGYNVAVGYGATAQSESIAIGSKTYVGQGSIAIGSKNGSNSGDGARAGDYSVAIGQTSKVLSNYSVALGYGAHDTSNSLNYSVGIGYNAIIDSSWSVALGDESKTEGSYGVEAASYTYPPLYGIV